MIRFYCQYSFGGFRTFRIYGNENEDLLAQEVDSAHQLDFPPQCNLYFNYGGAKLLYRRLANGETAIAVREIPGVGKDTDGRAIDCALQMVGSDDDRPIMDKIVLAIADNLDAFQSMFTEGFSLRGGLHYDGTILSGFIATLRDIELNAEGTALANLATRKGPVYLFVPSSKYFLSDKKLTDKVIAELQLGSTPEAVRNTLANTMSLPAFKALGGKISEVTEINKETKTDTTAEPEDTNVSKTKTEPKNTEPKDKGVRKSPAPETDRSLEIVDLERQVERLREEKLRNDLDKEKLMNEIRELMDKDRRRKNLIYLLTAGATALGIGFILALCLK